MHLKIFFLGLIALTTTLSAQNETPSSEKKVEKVNAPLTPLDPEAILKEQALEESSDTNFYKEFFNMLLTLGFLLVVLFAVSYFLRRMNLSRIRLANDSTSIKILDQRSLSARSSIFVLQYGNQEYLIGETSNGMTLLNRLEGQKNVEPDSPVKKFIP